VVGGRKGQRGVVTAASYEVRELGVRSGMSMTDAVRLAPDAVFLPTRHGTYSPYARQVRELLDRFSPVVQTASIDEFFVDFRGCERLYHRPGDHGPDATIHRVVHEMRQAIQDEIGLPASAGVGSTRVIAKIASGLAKPAGVHMVPVGAEHEFLDPLPVRAMPGIGPVCEAQLHAAGITTLGQLLWLRAGPLRARFGALSESIHRRIDGRRHAQLGSDRPAFQEHDPEGLTLGSISNERTFMADVRDRAAISSQVLALCERVCWRARRRGIRARTVTLKLRWSDFTTITRSRTLAPTNRDADVFGCVSDLLVAAITRHLPVRLLGVALSNLLPPDHQLPLPLAPPTRPEPWVAIDAVRDRFGYDAIRVGAAGGRTSWLA